MRKTKRILWLAAALAAVLTVAVAGCKHDGEDEWTPVTIRGTVLEKYSGQRTTVTIPDGVTSIGSKAFSGSGVTAVIIPSCKTIIAADAFEDSEVKSVSYLGTLDKWNELVRDGLAGDIKVSCFIIENGILTGYQGDETVVVIPAGYVKGIADGVFQNCAVHTKITSVTIPGSVKSIGANAFADCTALNNVQIEAGVAYIGAGAFAGCTELVNMVIPAGVTELGGGIFTGCTYLAELRIHESVTTIASGALTGTEGLKDMHYSGRKAQWEKVVAGKEQYFAGKTVHCADGKVWRYVPGQGAPTPGDDPGTGDEKDPNTGGEQTPKPDDPDNPDKPTCTEHTWGEYKSDNPVGHYQVCTECGEKSKTEEHVYDNDAECNTCGYRKANSGDPDCEHTFAVEHTENGHYRKCSLCGEEVGFENHQYDGAPYKSDGVGGHSRTCTTAGCGYVETEAHSLGECESDGNGGHQKTCRAKCGYFEPVAHVWSDEYTTDAGKHYKPCTVDGCTAHDGEGVHDYGTSYKNDGNGKHHQNCTVCGYQSDPVDHTWGAYTSDSNGHDRTCTATGCGYREHLNHDWSNYTSDGGTTHTRKCTATDEAHSETKDHEYKYEKINDTQHKVTCKDNCGYLDNSNHTWGEYTDNKNGTHTKTCQQECGDPVTEKHQYVSGACACGSHKPELAGGKIDENGVLVSYDKKDEKNVVIPDGVTGIGDNAFQGCWALETVVIPDSVTSIGDAAFAGCHGLAEVSIPSTVETVGGGAFQYCSKLEHLEIGDGVKRIDHGAFEGCVALTAVTIPGSVESVGQGAFKGCTGLKEVTIENGVKEIGADAFQGCTNLTDVTIPGSVDTIGQGAFQGCVGLKTIVIPEGVTGLGECAFQGCTNLTDVKIPASMDTIGNGAFAATGITVMTIPEGVKHIGDGAFQGCGSLKSVEISASVESIGFHAFFECANFETITYAGTADQWLNLTKDVDLGIGNNVMVKCSDGTDLPGGRRAN